jgi:hypothetical protein
MKKGRLKKKRKKEGLLLATKNKMHGSIKTHFVQKSLDLRKDKQVVCCSNSNCVFSWMP